MLHRILTAIRSGGGRRGLLSLVALVAAVGGVIAIVVAITAQQQAPEPSPSAAGSINPYPTTPTQTTQTTQTTQPSTTGTRPTGSPDSGHKSESATSPTQSAQRSDPATPHKPGQLQLPAAKPASIDIPAIGVHSAVFPIGKDADGGLKIPPPGPNQDKVAWYKNSPTPGQPGPSVIEGHIDTVQGPSVFYRLGAVKPGDHITITRKDNKVAVFTVNAVRSYPTHQDFPTKQVYGGDLVHPTLRVITCSNFDHSIDHYVGNTIVFAHLTGVHPAR